MNTRQTLLSLARWKDQEHKPDPKNWIARPVIPFRPKGLIIFGAAKDSYVQLLKVGNEIDLTADCEAIPMRYFEAGHSFEKLIELCKRGELELAVPERLVTVMATCSLGMNIYMQTTGRFDDAVLWGDAKNS